MFINIGDFCALYDKYQLSIMRESRKPESFVRGSPLLMCFFVVVGGREDPNTTIRGPMLAW